MSAETRQVVEVAVNGRIFIRDWLVAEYLSRNEYRGYQLASETGAEIAQTYGHFIAYDGLKAVCAGLSRNVRSTFDQYKDRLNAATIPIFLWRPDIAGTAAKWLDGPHPDFEPQCDECEGSGECPKCDGTGFRKGSLGVPGSEL